jgi:Ran GTPase-activating protein (RanGAP) involved in mRNA processing and transport
MSSSYSSKGSHFMMGGEELIDTYRPGERDAIEDVIINLREHQPTRLRLCVVMGLSDQEVVALADAIPSNILELRLNHCQPFFVQQVLEKLKRTPIQKLHLFGNQINDSLVQAVGELLQANQGLKEINLKHNAIESTGACSIANGLQNHSTLERVDLSDSLLDNRGKDALLEAMQHNSSVIIMNLAGKVFRSLPSQQSLGVMLRENSTLEDLDLRRNSLQRGEAIEMADALRISNRTLKILRLSNTNIDCRTAMALGQMLTCNNTLVQLDLGGNQKIGFVGAVAIAEGVRTLQHLDLRNTRLGAVGAQAVAQLISSNTTLKSLNLSRNNFGDMGAIHIAEALVKNTTLSTLSLSMCSITKTGAIFLGRNLPRMLGINHLFLYQNPIDEEGSEALLEGLKFNTSLFDFGVEKRFMSSCEQVSYYLKLNRVGRRALGEDLPDALWSRILSSRAMNADAMYYLLRQRPDLCATPIPTPS